MLAIIGLIALVCLVVCGITAICGMFAVRRDRIGFNVVGVTNERRTVELLCALRAAHQTKADAALERLYDDRVAMNRHLRAERRSRLYLIALDYREDIPASPFSIREQAG